MTDLDQRLLAAHERDDKPALIALYAEAAQNAKTSDAAGFYMTHAFVFALETGDPRSVQLRQWLVDQGREMP